MTYLYRSLLEMRERARRELSRRRYASLEPRPGQSLVELSLLVPIVVLAMLGVANLGLAVRAQTDLAQSTQQGAQYLFRHPVNTPSTCSASIAQYTSCTDAAMASYLANAGFPNSTVTTTFGSTATGVLEETFSVSAAFTLYMPSWSGVSLGALHGNVVNLGAGVTTIAATASPMVSTATRAGSQVQVSWSAPPPLGLTAPAVPLTVTYRLYGQLPGYDQGGLDLLTTDALSGTATITDTTSVQISLTAVQANGLESPPSSPPVAIQ